MASWRFRQAAEAPIPRTFVTDSLGWQASKGGDACPGLGQGGNRRTFRKHGQSLFCSGYFVDGLEEEWRATLLAFEAVRAEFHATLPVDALGKEQQG
ncbi:uncharacterized protein TrAFT101_009312 [Trichoderma asperellum]|uniref:uncharacterized protein n=1 Tax=Trichoderma asperellum TaxID=101201 RepID=UPI0033182957|nr:hypothetical protein TrAFT101_009312 [Trichoderma asperellum]